jgi:hypothetical protein
MNITINGILINNGAHLNIQYVVFDGMFIGIARSIIKPLIVAGEV